MTYFETMNPSVEACTFTSHGDELEDESNMFWAGASFEESFQTFSIGELSLFKRLFTLLATCENHVVW
jgi:hypothetical protein